MGISVFDASQWTAVQWSLYAIVIGMVFGFVGTMLAGSVINMWIEDAKKAGKEIDWRSERNKWLLFFLAFLLVFLIFLMIWPPSVP